MGVFDAGPPAAFPAGVSVCIFGKWGWFGRFIRDACYLPLSNLVAFVLTFVTGVICGVLAFIVNHQGNFVRIYDSALATLVGFGIAIGAIAGFLAVTRRGKGNHWRSGFFVGRDGSEGITLTSHHWHEIRDLALYVVGPNDQHWTVEANPKYPTFAAKAGEPVGSFRFSQVMGVSPTPGRYRFEWSMDVSGRSSPLVLASDEKNL